MSSPRSPASTYLTQATERAAATHPPPPSKTTPSPSPPLSPRPASPVEPSYATVPSLPPPTPSLTPSKPHRTTTPTPPAQNSTPPTPVVTPTTPKTTPQPRPKQTSSHVLSIYDLERRFQHTPTPFYNPQRHISPRKTPTTALARILHSIADLFECHTSPTNVVLTTPTNPYYAPSCHKQQARFSRRG
ncbi:hypothetical protein BGW36DRAFT_410440 [Talaromyces proteolyticus]|uniref:Uncharacterized protein n=1 Tax=Talaromyces proteolyticus TaxID=1131652 RepID=A0AAD4KJM7_9EURO|nr:uncharacterized protein BGW36DRAFT_410440 [Talaromyces proteolyticus]KAH8691853.1 hypothetical protein BGW36DRAFT_410440 [Talaromyces proteolyticus]